jgi:hypothetical protein
MTEKTENQTVENPVPEAAPQQQSGPDLTVQDLTILRNIIDISASRGAFKPNEMATVGNVYNKLNTFLDGIKQGQE